MITAISLCKKNLPFYVSNKAIFILTKYIIKFIVDKFAHCKNYIFKFSFWDYLNGKSIKFLQIMFN